jgi:hypothetical protein
MVAVGKECQEKENKKNALNPDTIKKINSEIAKLPACPEKGQQKALNFDYCLALFKILTYHGAYEKFLFKEEA